MPKKTFRLLIIDDEKYIRDLIKFSIDWDILDINICGEASCAEEGYQLVEDLKPHIIITDIYMDGKNGIEFSKTVLERHPYIKIILLSGHSEFDFATKGIDIGVSAYLLKPLNEEVMIETISKLKNTILEENKRQKEFKKLKEYIKNNKDYLVQNKLNSLITNKLKLDHIIKELNYLGVSFQHNYFQVACFEIQPPEDFEGLFEEYQLLLQLECNSMLKNAFQKFTNVYIFYDSRHRNILLSNNPDIDLIDILENTLNTIIERLSCSLTVGVGKPVSILSKIKNSYKNAREAVRYQSIFGNNQIIQYDNITFSNQEPENDLDDLIPRLLDLIKTEQLEDALLIINICIDNSIEEDLTDIVPVRITASMIINHIMNMLLQGGLKNTEAFHYCLDAYERLFRMQTVDELRNLTHNLTRAVIEKFASIRNEKNNTLITSIIKYINENYSNPDLTLTLIAKTFYINPSYLSRVFKFSTNCTFTKYLRDLRLDKAKSLLLNTSKRIYEISTEVGFSDTKYFSVCFKKQFGMTTTEFREQNFGKHVGL